MPEFTVPASRRKNSPRRLSPRLVVAIDDETIRSAIQRSSSHCMISEAIAKLLPEAKHVSTDLGSIRWTDPVKRVRYTYLTPRAAQVALIQFDRGEQPAPFTFKLERASHITRNRPRGQQPKVDSSMRAERNRVNKAQYQAATVDGIAASSPEDRKRIRETLAQPYEPLGTARAYVEQGAETPVIIGGHAPASVGNLARVRRFGIRQYRE